MRRIKKSLCGVVLAVMIVCLQLRLVHALETTVKTSGEVHMFYLDPQTQSATLPDGFTLGSNSVNTLSEDLTTEHTFVQFDAATEENVSGTLRLNLSDPLTNTGGSITHPRIENAFIEISKVKGAPDDLKVKLGQFYVPFGLRVWHGLDYKVDRGIEISGKQNEISWKAALANGAQDNSKEFFIDASTNYESIPLGVSYYRGRTGVNTSRALGVNGTYNPMQGTSIAGQYIWSKIAGVDTNWLYVKGAYSLESSPTTMYVKYYEMSPKNVQVTSWFVTGFDYKYSETIMLGAEYIMNDEPAKINNNVWKAKIKFTF